MVGTKPVWQCKEVHILKITILLPNLSAGGAERVNIDLAHEFCRAGHKVEFAVMQRSGELLGEADAAFPVVDLAVDRFRNSLLPLVRYLRRSRPDAVLASMWPLTAAAPVAAKLARAGSTVVAIEHGMLSAQYKPRGRLHRLFLRASTWLGYNLADKRVGVSGGVAADMSALSGVPASRFDVVHNPVPLQPSAAGSARELAERLWAVPEGSRVLAVGKLKAVKNHPLLIRAFAQVERPGATLMFVGDGEMRESLEALAHSLGVVERVVFAGFQANPSSFYESADVFVLSSDREGLPTVLIEALAKGTPVVSTDCPSGPAEILENGRYGELVPVGDAEALAAAIERSLSARHDTAALRRRAEDFAPAIAAKKYLELISPGG